MRKGDFLPPSALRFNGGHKDGKSLNIYDCVIKKFERKEILKLGFHHRGLRVNYKFQNIEERSFKLCFGEILLPVGEKLAIRRKDL